MDIKRRIITLERYFKPPGPSPVVVVKPGDPIPPGTRVAVINDIPKHGTFRLASGEVKRW